jgi:hypothetical protein
MEGERPEDAIERLIKEAFPDSIISHFVAVFEVTEGLSQDLRLAMSDGMTPWLANGMLLGATRMVDAFSEDDYDFEEDDDDDL